MGCFSVPACAIDIILNPNLNMPSVSRETIRGIFTLRLRRWPNGELVRAFVLPDRHPVHREFSKHVIRVFPHQLRRAWDRRVFSGTGQAPTEVADEQEMLRAVAETPGAVGYTSDGVGDGNVRIVPVE